jgi:hypothetical protein
MRNQPAKSGPHPASFIEIVITRSSIAIHTKPDLL